MLRTLADLTGMLCFLNRLPDEQSPFLSTTFNFVSHDTSFDEDAFLVLW